MSSHDPLISVIIPIYNAERYLAEAIDSVLAQTYPVTEIILSDDGSTDASPAVAARYSPPAVYLTQPNGGPAAALNQGIRAARGEYLSFLSADDIWVPEKLEWELHALRTHPNVAMVFGQMQHFLSPELDQATRKTLHCPPEPMEAYAAGTLLISREVFLQVGYFNQAWRAGEFMDWHARATDAGLTSLLVPQVLSRRRVHGANHTVRTERVSSSYAAVLKACLDRRRASNKQS